MVKKILWVVFVLAVLVTGYSFFLDDGSSFNEKKDKTLLDLILVPWNAFSLSVHSSLGFNTTWGEFFLNAVGDVLFGILFFMWIVLFELIYLAGFIGNPDFNVLKRYAKSYLKKVFIGVIIYVILEMVPILNRFIQIITFEFLGLNIILRSFILSAIIYYGLLYVKRYNDYKKRMKKYDSKLEEYALKEAAKIGLKG
ncbi:hypothetical protein COU54_03790 [Candidatus Pacearchaeota archaeon CG10_big_fil_rev_8_21_14_0_10_31_24]|nr:MAG: hypothetical protein COU54_03790 [Candidatus Pacearchaeota archaeon CG10_big_fil_rev_8_21_14_0_10_31_24]